MIRFPCDRCARDLEVDDDLAGRKVACPVCHDVNNVPPATPRRRSSPRAPLPPESPESPDSPKALESSESPSRVDRAARAGLPPDLGPEVRVMFIRPAMFRARPFVFLGWCTLAAAGLAAAGWHFVAGSTSPAGPYVGWGGLFAAIIGAAALAAWRVLTLGAGLEITTKRTVQSRGLFSRSTSEVLHDDIRNIQVTQTFFNRLLGVGRIGISSAGQEGVEIVMDHVPRPHHVRRTIDLYRPL